MKRVKLIATAMVLAVLAVLTANVAAQQTNVSERTFLTFSSAVEMPGVTLQPGTYVFKLADTPSRNVVQVWDNEEKNMIGHWLFVQAERPEVSGENVVMFKEAREGTTPAVQFWYFPGEKIGKEFVYPKAQATQIAQRTGQDVMSDEGKIAGSVTSTDAQGQVTEWQREQTATTASAEAQGAVAGAGVSANADASLNNAPASAQPSAAAGSLAGNRGAEVSAQAETRAPAEASVQAESQVAADNSAQTRSGATAGAVGTSGSDDSQAAGNAGVRQEGTTARNELPATASPLALSGLIGLLSLAGALGIRAVR